MALAAALARGDARARERLSDNHCREREEDGDGAQGREELSASDPAIGAATRSNQERTTTNRSPASAAIPIAALAWLLAVEAGVELWYRLHERDLVSREQWTVRFPENAPGFREIEIDEQVQSTLRYDSGRQVAWQPELPTSDGSSPTNNRSRVTDNRRSAATAFLFFFRWEPGTSTILRARSHRPDVCLPNVGWNQSGDFGVRDYDVGGAATLPFRHFAFVRKIADQPTGYAHSFFCMREDKVRPASGAFDLTADARPSEWMPSERIRVVREGLRNPGQQVMQFVLITSAELPADAAEARFRELLPQLVAIDAPRS
ncbi:MAG TPA: hypothetical protein VK993_02730 [Chthoniobacterales bacterium]|nr:hypothetical protein [Chthoniobacterales bacterium]